MTKRAPYRPYKMPLAEWLIVKRRIDPDTGCWIWTGGKIARGYGVTKIPRGKNTLVHRFAYKTWVDPDLPDDICVLHSCDNPPCFNPEHLWTGTRRDNADDRDSKGRNVVHYGDAHWMRKHPERIARGERHGNTTLTSVQVIAIRSDDRPVSAIAQAHGISKQSVWDIKARRSWGHLD